MKVNLMEPTIRVTGNTKKTNVLRVDENTKDNASPDIQQRINNNILLQSKRRIFKAESLDGNVIGLDTISTSNKNLGEEEYIETNNTILDEALLEHKVTRRSSHVKKNAITQARKVRRKTKNAENFKNIHNCEHNNITASEDRDITSEDRCNTLASISILNKNHINPTETNEQNGDLHTLNNVSKNIDNELAGQSCFKKKSTNANSLEIKENSKEPTPKLTKNIIQTNVLQVDVDIKGIDSPKIEKCINSNKILQSKEANEMVESLDKNVIRLHISEEEYIETNEIVLEKEKIDREEVKRASHFINRNTVLQPPKIQKRLYKAESLDDNEIGLETKSVLETDLGEDEYIERNDTALDEILLEDKVVKNKSQIKTNTITLTQQTRRKLSKPEKFNNNQNYNNINNTESEIYNITSESISTLNKDYNSLSETSEIDGELDTLNNVPRHIENELADPSQLQNKSMCPKSLEINVKLMEPTMRVTKNIRKTNMLRVDENTKGYISRDIEQYINFDKVSQSKKSKRRNQKTECMTESLDKNVIGLHTSDISNEDLGTKEYTELIEKVFNKKVLQHETVKSNSGVQRKKVSQTRKPKVTVNKVHTSHNNMSQLETGTVPNKELDDTENFETNEIVLEKTELTGCSKEKIIFEEKGKRESKILFVAQKKTETCSMFGADSEVQYNSKIEVNEKWIFDKTTSDSEDINTKLLSKDHHFIENYYLKNEKVSKEVLNENSEVIGEDSKEIQKGKKLSAEVHTANLCAILEQYDFKNFNETFDFTNLETEKKSKKIQVTKHKGENQSILHGLLYYESNDINNKNLKSSPILKNLIPDRISNNKNIDSFYKVTLLPTVARNGKNCLRSHIKTDPLEKMYYTKGPDINDKSANLPEMLLRLAERKRNETENKLLRRKIEPNNIFQLKLKYRVLNHVFILKQLIEKCRVYKQSLFLVFVDFKINNEHVESGVLNELKTYEALDKLFKVKWPYEGIVIKDKAINHLRLKNHVVFVGDTVANIKIILEDILLRSNAAKLSVDQDKLEIISTDSIDFLEVLNIKIPLVPQREHLGHVFSFVNMQEKEIERRIELGMQKFESLKNELNHLPLGDQKKLFNDNILSVITEKAETWNITKQLITKFRRAQLNMERQMLNIDVRKKVSDKEVRLQTGFSDVGQTICTMKLKFVSQLIKYKEDEPFKDLFRILTWSPGVQRVGRPPKQWSDDIEAIAGISWKRFDVKFWNILEESYVNKWAPSIV